MNRQLYRQLLRLGVVDVQLSGDLLTRLRDAQRLLVDILSGRGGVLRLGYSKSSQSALREVVFAYSSFGVDFDLSHIIQHEILLVVDLIEVDSLPRLEDGLASPISVKINYFQASGGPDPRTTISSILLTSWSLLAPLTS